MAPRRVDPYEVLGLERGATWAEIRAAYRRLAKKHHPDKNPGDNASEWIFKEVGRAYEHLRGVHGAHAQTEERTRRGDDPGRQSDYDHRERQARAQWDREQRQRAERGRQEQERAQRREREQRERRQAQAARERREQPKSGRTARDSRDGMRREQRGWRESAWPLFIVAALVLLGIATAIYDTLPDRAVPSVTEIEREARPPRLSSTATAPQGLVPIAEGGSTSSGPSSAPVRLGNDVSPGRTVRSSANGEREGAPARPPGANVTGAGFFTRGSHEDKVLRIQGTPTSINRYPGLGYEIWRYGRSNITISTRSRQVTEWSNPTGNLKVRLPPGANVTGAGFFTRGSHEDEVLRIQGTPTGINRYPGLGYEIWRYGRSNVTISTHSRQVTEWSNPTGNLKVRLPPGANVTGAGFFTRGSDEDEVLRIQGTPTGINRYPGLGYEIWRYGRNNVTISTRSRQVTEWSNPTGNLKVRLPPGANVTGAGFFTRGSHEDEVLRIQGTPTGINRYPGLGYEIWRYGRNNVTISTRSRQVTEWSNPTGNLRVR